MGPCPPVGRWQQQNPISDSHCQLGCPVGTLGHRFSGVYMLPIFQARMNRKDLLRSTPPVAQPRLKSQVPGQHHPGLHSVDLTESTVPVSKMPASTSVRSGTCFQGDLSYSIQLTHVFNKI